MKSSDPKKFPVDGTATFNPDGIFYLQRSSGFSHEGEVKEVTSKLANILNTSNLDIEEAAELAKSLEPSYIMKRKSWVPTRIEILKPDQSSAATMTTSIFSRGIKKLQFPPGSTASDHNIEVGPVGPTRKEECFVKDSVLYYWNSEGAKNRKLYKTVGQKSIQIGGYEAKHDRSTDGVLSLMTSELDALLGIVTCYSYVTQGDSFW